MRNQLAEFQERHDALVGKSDIAARSNDRDGHAVMDKETLYATTIILQRLIAAAVEYEAPKSNKLVKLGSTVTLSFDNAEAEIYQVGTPLDVKYAKNKAEWLSNESRVGKALLNETVGKKLKVELEDKSITIVKILSIQ